MLFQIPMIRSSKYRLFFILSSVDSICERAPDSNGRDFREQINVSSPATKNKVWPDNVFRSSTRLHLGAGSMEAATRVCHPGQNPDPRSLRRAINLLPRLTALDIPLVVALQL
jgi:hypothetical protein